MGPILDGVTVLIVDDDPTVTAYLCAALGELGGRVTACHDPTHALARLRDGERALPDAVVLDLEMPAMHGLELLVALRADPRTRALPVVVASGRSDRESKLRAFDRGADDFVGKPMDAGELAARVAVHVRKARAARRMREAAVMDELTGVRNRRGVFDALRVELSRARRTGRPLAVLVVDVDRFKAINDNYGHRAGDAALSSIARRLAEQLRTTDVVGRIGGDEFLVVLPDVDRSLAESVAVRIRRAASTLTVGPHDEAISVSVGLAVCGHDAVDPEDLIEGADSAMYRDKRRPREAGSGAAPTRGHRAA